MRMSTMASYQEIVKSLQGSSAVMSKMNEQMDVGAIRDVLKEFNKETMKQEMNQEAVSHKLMMTSYRIELINISNYG